MICVFCKKPAGFLKSQHFECYDATQKLLQKMEKVVNQYNSEPIDHSTAKKELVALVSSDALYKNYLLHEIADKTAIRTKDIIIYSERMVTISESKNRCSMLRTGLSYSRYPVWKECNKLLCEYGQVVFTDKGIYLLLTDAIMMFTYNKIVNIGFDDVRNCTYFDIKTSSPFSHRFSIRATNRKDKNKVQNVCLFLNCLADL